MVAISEWFERERARQEIRELEEMAWQILERTRRPPGRSIRFAQG